MQIGDYVYVTLARNRGAFRVDNVAEPCKHCKMPRWYVQPLEAREATGIERVREYMIVHEKYLRLIDKNAYLGQTTIEPFSLGVPHLDPENSSKRSIRSWWKENGDTTAWLIAGALSIILTILMIWAVKH